MEGKTAHSLGGTSAIFKLILTSLFVQMEPQTEIFQPDALMDAIANSPRYYYLKD